ncbi:hypothetical protein CFELI_03085 [Corynebacterium felinum]|uniref:Uncharacterized protein n=1 Tax=Corynebacterium felinum TaxID=131318 RepID=A0ABU2BA86_9CORY|nr:hypothetical protein [Corynebacterium felinum]WJY94259.1 hypothetical protein CFELI_03085 [Corynebacterium felinum]
MVFSQRVGVRLSAVSRTDAPCSLTPCARSGEGGFLLQVHIVAVVLIDTINTVFFFVFLVVKGLYAHS